MSDLIKDYKKNVLICSKTNYDDKSSIKENNKAVRKMYAIIEKIKNNEEKIKEFVKLLDDESCSPWLAHQLLEKVKLGSSTEEKCLKIIKKLAETNIGEQMWLKDWEEKGRT